MKYRFQEAIRPIYLGMSPSTRKHFFVMPRDETVKVSYLGAIAHIRHLNMTYRPFGHCDWRLPTIDELQVVFNHRARLDCRDNELYISETPRIDLDACYLDFSHGTTLKLSKDSCGVLRCVRSGGPTFGSAKLTSRP